MRMPDPASYSAGFDGPGLISRLNNDTTIDNGRPSDPVWPDGDLWKSGLMTQALMFHAS